MKRGARLLCLLLVAAFLVGCAPQGQTEDPVTAPDSSGAAVDSQGAVLTEQALTEIKTLGESPDDNYRTWYEIFVYSFCDSDGDGIGDLKGVISKLDYLQELGITGIWFMPVHPSQSYHKYDVADYYEIDPAYGTMEDMETLLAECEARGIKVIMDLVLNHTANNHAWFQTAVEYLRTLPAGAEPDVEACPYVDYYYFKQTTDVGYNNIGGAEWYYECKFSPDMPDLNLANETIRGEIKAIMEFWLGKGVHGFRLDAVKEFYSGNAPANIEVLAWIQETAASIKEDVYLVGEAWEGFGGLTPYYSSGMTSFFDFPFGTTDGKIAKVLRGAGTTAVNSYAVTLGAVGWSAMLRVEYGVCMVMVVVTLYLIWAKPLARNMVGATVAILCGRGSLLMMAAPMGFLAVHCYNEERNTEENRYVSYLAYPVSLLVIAIAGKFIV